VPRGALAAGVAVASTIAVAVLVSWQNPRDAIGGIQYHTGLIPRVGALFGSAFFDPGPRLHHAALSELSFEEQQLSGGGKFRGARLREGAGRGWLPGGVQNAPDVRGQSPTLKMP
jgi:hypothetical protein